MPEKKGHVEAITHEEARRPNIPTSELESALPDERKKPVRVEYARRNPDLDPQLIWRGKFDGEDTLTVKAPPLYIQEKIHPKALIEDLRLAGQRGDLAEEIAQYQINLFADFNGFAKDADKMDFYQHDQNWTNRMILGDSLQVMASLAEREGLRGQVQAIYLDPPYGIKFNSNFQWSTNSRDVKDGKDFTREPEQVKAFRDTWEDGIHSYLGYLRDRFIVARDLLTDSGSIFVQIGDENVHRVRCLLDEIFGEKNFVSQVSFATTTGFSGNLLSSIFNHIIWYAKDIKLIKYNQIYYRKEIGSVGATKYKLASSYASLKNNPFWVNKFISSDPLTSQGDSEKRDEPFKCRGVDWYVPSGLHWKTTNKGLMRLDKASRLIFGNGQMRYVRASDDFPAIPITNFWNDIGGVQSRTDSKVYVVQTSTEVIKRCLLMATDPGDLVLDPTCGSGTTAYVAEQWGRRWITIDTSRVALALARARLMGARYPYYLMADSPAGQLKEAEISGEPAAQTPCGNNINFGFVYERVPHITLKAIANNVEIDDIWEKWQATLEPLREKLNKALGKDWQEWEIPRDAGADWPEAAQKPHKQWWDARIARQKEIDASIAARAEYELLYDRPYEDRKKVRVAGPFTVESISPYRVLGVDADGGVLDPRAGPGGEGRDFVTMILDNLRAAGVQQAHKADKIDFTSLTPWPGDLICADGRYQEGEQERRAAIFIGPEFGTVSRADLACAAREASEAKFDLLIACAFNYDASSEELRKMGYLPIIKARMNADLHMSANLKKTDRGNLFVVFGEPDLEIAPELENGAETGRIRVKLNGVDVYNPAKGEIISDNADDIACWFIDTDYNGESFFVRQAYFLGQKNPYESLSRALNAEIDRDAWESLNSAISRPFPKPKNGRIAVKVINHLGDEVMKVFRV